MMKRGLSSLGSFGWLREYPDIRDYTPEHPAIAPLMKKLGSDVVGLTALPPTYDLKQWFSPIEDQEQLGSCTAHAAVGLLEYYERRAYGRYIDASRLFVYKATRNLLGLTGDTGAYLRTTLGSLVLFGAPPEKFWPYDISKYDEEPPAFCYCLAQNYQAVKYSRLDTNVTHSALLDRIKSNIKMGLPAMFGFTVYSCVSQAETTGKIPFPTTKDSVEGGHAIIAAGYDDGLKITNTGLGGKTTTGALLIRNSWGTSWGNSGYGWLPYEYVLQGLTSDWWQLISNEWVETGQFGV